MRVPLQCDCVSWPCDLLKRGRSGVLGPMLGCVHTGPLRRLPREGSRSSRVEDAWSWKTEMSHPSWRPRDLPVTSQCPLPDGRDESHLNQPPQSSCQMPALAWMYPVRPVDEPPGWTPPISLSQTIAGKSNGCCFRSLCFAGVCYRAIDNWYVLTILLTAITLEVWLGKGQERNRDFHFLRYTFQFSLNYFISKYSNPR